MPSPSSGFDFTVTGISGVFKNHRLKVPLHQREYSWDIEQVNQLLTDLSAAKQEGESHFLGTLVAVKSGTQPLEIVDGQQRLTTTYLLILSIRRHLENLEGAANDLAVESINTEYLNTIDREASERVPKLSLNVDDNDFFRTMIGAQEGTLEPTRDSHELLMQALNATTEWVATICKPYDDSGVPSVLNSWLTFLDNDAEVVLLTTENGSQAFKMFETLNDRGLRTSQVDLVKSYLFGQSGSRISEAQGKWSSMRENLEEIDDDERTINFLRHAFVATRRFVRSDEVYDAVGKAIRGTSPAITYLSELEILSRAYAATYSPSSDYWSGQSTACTRALTEINRFNIRSARPLLMALGRNFSGKELEKSLKLLLSVSVRLLVTSGTRSGVVEQAFGSAALAVTKQEVSTAAALKPALTNVLTSDGDFKEAFARLRSSKPDLARYYLRALEMQTAGESEPWYVPNEDAADITLEHILPKNPKAEDWPNFDEEAKKALTRRLGNMCLLKRSENSDTGNVSFDKKKEVLGASPYALTKQVAENDDWTQETIESRQAAMAETALKTWPL